MAPGLSGPLGAAIGAAAGFGIGIGEKLAGVESPQAEAHRLIKNIYGMDIPTNSGTVKQVVQISRSRSSAGLFRWPCGRPASGNW